MARYLLCEYCGNEYPALIEFFEFPDKYSQWFDFVISEIKNLGSMGGDFCFHEISREKYEREDGCPRHVFPCSDQFLIDVSYLDYSPYFRAIFELPHFDELVRLGYNLSQLERADDILSFWNRDFTFLTLLKTNNRVSLSDMQALIDVEDIYYPLAKAAADGGVSFEEFTALADALETPNMAWKAGVPVLDIFA